MAIELYDYQKEALFILEAEVVFGDNRIIAELCTGSGKTLVFASFAINYAKKANMKTVIAIQFSDLIDQWIKAFKMLDWDNYGVIKAGYEEKINYDAPIQLIMEQTFDARIESFDHLKCDFLLLEEAHNRIKGERIRRIINTLQPNTIIGFTGTPYNSKGCRFKDYETVRIIKSSRLLQKGKLTPIKHLQANIGLETSLSNVESSSDDYSMESLSSIYDTIAYNQAIVDGYELYKKQYNPNPKSIWFCTTTAHCEHLAEMFQQRGHNIIAYTSKTKNATEIVEAFRTNTHVAVNPALFGGSKKLKPIEGLVSVAKIAIGFDVPDVDTASFCLTTKIRSKYVQGGSRCNRLSCNKDVAYILDFGQNIVNHGEIYEDYEPPEEEDLKEYKEQFKMKNIELIKDGELFEISRAKLVAKIEEIKNNKTPLSQMSVEEIAQKFKVEEEPFDVLLITMALLNKLYANDTGSYTYMKYNRNTGKEEPKLVKNFYSINTANWIYEDWLKLFEDFKEDKLRVESWKKAFKTFCKTIVNKRQNIYSLKFKPNWLREEKMSSESIPF